MMHFSIACFTHAQTAYSAHYYTSRYKLCLYTDIHSSREIQLVFLCATTWDGYAHASVPHPCTYLTSSKGINNDSTVNIHWKLPIWKRTKYRQCRRAASFDWCFDLVLLVHTHLTLPLGYNSQAISYIDQFEVCCGAKLNFWGISQYIQYSIVHMLYVVLVQYPTHIFTYIVTYLFNTLWYVFICTAYCTPISPIFVNFWGSS